MSGEFPKLKTANKIPAPYPLGSFPKKFAFEVGKQVVYLLATKATPTLEGEEWERIFASSIGADWKPSNVGLDDIVLQNCAWGAKTVKANRPWTQSSVRLISGRNSLAYSYGDSNFDAPPEELGRKVLEIWNVRVEDVRSRYPNLRTVVLVKSSDLLKLTVFETETVRYDPEVYTWQWNPRHNLEGFDGRGTHKFTWQPHGSQFTIVEQVPITKLCIQLKKPEKLGMEDYLSNIGFDDSWVEIH